MQGNAPGQRKRTTDVMQARNAPSGVSEGTIGHLQNSASVAADTHEGAGRREGELHGGRG